MLPAEGFGDFGRAIRQKFVVEVSGGKLPRLPANVYAFGGDATAGFSVK